jgi:zinc transport system substrate-binding protein
MTTKQNCRLFTFLLTWLIVTGSATAAVKAPQIRVFVSILPVEYFVDRIGRDRVLVETLVQPGHSPATYAPTPQQIARLARSQLYFRVGVPFENTLVPKLERSVSGLEIIDLRGGIDMMHLSETHAEHDEHEGDMDPHTWLDPSLAVHQAALIRNALIQFDPDGETQYRTNFADLEAELSELDRTLRENLRPFAGKPMYVFHPAYGYFCRAYNLRQKAINPDGKEPGAKHLARLIEEARQDRVRVIFVQAQFSRKAADTVAGSIGCRVVPLDPLARDYPANMMYIAGQVIDSLSEAKTGEHKETQ